jgi:hypothetical protein
MMPPVMHAMNLSEILPHIPLHLMNGHGLTGVSDPRQGQHAAGTQDEQGLTHGCLPNQMT